MGNLVFAVNSGHLDNTIGRASSDAMDRVLESASAAVTGRVSLTLRRHCLKRRSVVQIEPDNPVRAVAAAQLLVDELIAVAGKRAGWR
jgi:hypothetical protein